MPKLSSITRNRSRKSHLNTFEHLDPRILLSADLAENNAALWGSFASDNASTTVSLDTSHVKQGSSSIHLRTESGFDTGVVFPKTNDAHWDLTSQNYLSFWSFSDNQTPVGFQGNQPIIVLQTTGGTITYTPSHLMHGATGWAHFFVPLAGSSVWTKTTTGTPNLNDVLSLEIHQDTWDSGFDMYYDAVSFEYLDGSTSGTTPPGVNPDEIAPKILLYVFDPILENKGGVRTHTAYGWQDPVTLTNQSINDLKTSSHGILNYQIVDTVIADVHPYYDDGTQLNDASFVTNWESRVFPTGHFDYVRFVEENDIAQRIDSGEIDEVWIYTSPMGGTWESAMAGQGAYWINGPTQDVPSSRAFPIMGLNYERGVGEAIHSFGHRSEGSMDHSYGPQSANLNNNWNKFTYQNRYGAGSGGVGNIHFPVNGTSDYDYDNTTSVLSNADDWANYPNFTGTTRSINSNEWSPTHIDPHRDYLNWWYSHLPHFSGKAPDGFLNNWWRYIADPNQFKAGTKGQLNGSGGVAQIWNRGILPNQELTGLAELAAEAVSDGAVGRVDFYIDGQFVGTDSLAPYTFKWDTTTWTEGRHTIVTKVYELQHNAEFVSEPLTVVVNNDPPLPYTDIGVWRAGKFYIDANQNRLWNNTTGGDQLFSFGATTDLPLTGDWNGDGITDIGTWRAGKFYLDANGNRAWNNTSGGDFLISFGATTDLPITGDWNGDGLTDIGAFRNGKFYLDANGNRKWDGTTGGDQLISFGTAGDLPVIGDWNGDEISDIGIIRNGKFYLDANGNRAWNNIAGGDAYFNFGTTGDKPVVGDWNSDGKSDVGIVRGATFYLDANGNRAWNNIAGGDAKFNFGSVGDTPLIGRWSLPVPVPLPTSSFTLTPLTTTDTPTSLESNVFPLAASLAVPVKKRVPSEPNPLDQLFSTPLQLA